MTLRAPASSPAQAQTEFTSASAEGRWFRPAPCLPSRKRSSMEVRFRNPEPGFQSDEVRVVGGDVGDDEADGPDVISGATEGERELVFRYGPAPAGPYRKTSSR